MYFRSCFILGLAAVVLGGCGRTGQEAAAGRASARQPQRVEVVSIKTHRLMETLDVTGTLEANESVQIRPELAGVVKQIFFKEGQVVERGEVLLQIDDAELRAQLAQAEARAELARLNLERFDRLVASRSIPASDLDQARAERAASEAEVTLLKVRLERSTLRAPLAGTLGSRTVSPGEYVTPLTVVTTLDDLSRLKLSFFVPERHLAKVRLGTEVVAQIAAGGGRNERIQAEGQVFFVNSSLNPAVRASEVRAVLDSPPAGLKPGMFAAARIILEVKEGVLAVPEAALSAGQRGVQIITVDRSDGAPKAAYVSVETGLRTHGLVEIRPVEGEIREGTEVVASGVGALVLFPGARLDPVPLRAAFDVTAGGGS